MRSFLLLSSLLLQNTLAASLNPKQAHDSSATERSVEASQLTEIEKRQSNTTGSAIGDPSSDDSSDGGDFVVGDDGDIISGEYYPTQINNLQIFVMNSTKINATSVLDNAQTANLAYINAQPSTQTLKTSNNEPYVFTGPGDSTSDRLQIVGANSPGTPDLTWAQLSAAMTAAQSYQKSHGNQHFSNLYIVDTSNGQSNYIGLAIMGTTPKVNPPVGSATPPSPVVTIPGAGGYGNSSLEIKVDTSNSSTKGSIDAELMTEQLQDAMQWASQYKDQENDGLVRDQGENPWCWNVHSAPSDKAAFSLSLVQLQDVHWSDLVATLSALSNGMVGKGYFMGGAITVTNKATQQVIMSGYIAANAPSGSTPSTPSASSSSTSTSSSSSTSSPMSTSSTSPVSKTSTSTSSSTSSSSSSAPATSSGAAKPLGPTAGNVQLTLSSINTAFTNTKGDATLDHCNAFKSPADLNPNPFDQAYLPFNNTPARANHEFIAQTQFVSTQPKIGGATNGNKIGAVALINPCTELGATATCPAGSGLYGNDIALLFTQMRSGGKYPFCVKATGTYGSSGQHTFTIQLTAEDSPSFQSFDNGVSYP